MIWNSDTNGLIYHFWDSPEMVIRKSFCFPNMALAGKINSLLRLADYLEGN